MRDADVEAASPADDPKLSPALRLITSASSPLTRCLYMALFVVSLSGLSYQLFHLISDYMEEPTASIVTISYPDQFPAIVFCPPLWYNVTKARQLGIDAEMFFYLHTIFYWKPDDDEQLEWTTFNQTEAMRRLQNINITNSHLLIQNVLDRFPDLDTLLHAIAYEADEILWAGIDIPPVLEMSRFLTTTYGMCFMYKHTRVFTDDLSIQEESLDLCFNYYPDYEEFTSYYTFYPAVVHLGDAGDSVRPSGENYIQVEKDYVMKLTYRHTLQLDLRRKRCRKWNSRKRMDCIYNCILRYCRSKDICGLFVPGTNQTRIDEICTSLDWKNHCFYQISDSNCSSQCNIECEDKVYIASLQAYGSQLENETTQVNCVYISYDNLALGTKIEEQRIYDLYTTLSNIGGAASLWCGASIISLTQLSYYLCNVLCKKMKHIVPESENKKM